MIIHIFADTPHHFFPMQAFFQKLDLPEQQFWVKSPTTDKLKQAGFTCYENNQQLFQLLDQLPKQAKVTFHGVFDIHTWKGLLFHPILSRSNCVLWGAEIYRHQKPGRNLKERVARFIHAAFLLRLNKVFALNKGDAELTKQLLFRKSVDVLPYPLIGMAIEDSQDHDRPAVLIGNSAAASNRHKFIIDQLAAFNDTSFDVVACLNYGGEQDYVDEVVAYGKEKLGERFQPITKMLEKSQYDALLNKVSGTVFAQHRQQGLYVAYAMLLMGKPIFLLQSTSSYKNLSELGFNIHATDSLAEMSAAEFAQVLTSEDKKNKQLMQSHFTEAALAPKWYKQLSE